MFLKARKGVVKLALQVYTKYCLYVLIVFYIFLCMCVCGLAAWHSDRPRDNIRSPQRLHRLHSQGILLGLDREKDWVIDIFLSYMHLLHSIVIYSMKTSKNKFICHLLFFESVMITI